MLSTFVRRLALASFAASMFSACGPGISVNSDYDPRALPAIQDFETYAWLPHPSQGRDANQLIEGRVMSAVDAQMAGKGYTKVARDPDFLLGWHVAADDKVDVQTFNNYYGYGYNYWGYGGPLYNQETYVRQYTEGSLLLDVVDASSNQLVWRGAAHGEVDLDASPEERQAKINDAVSMILDRFPPEM